jgi:hypothetical protein
MKKDFVEYPEALALKELGFDEPCFAYYRDNRISGVNRWNRKDWEFHVISNKDITSTTNEIVLVPTYSQCFRWFREKYDLYINVTRYNDEDEDKFLYYIDSGDVEEEFNTYEEAELACLNQLIEIVKTKNI